jgi:signal transduction histidine kinase
MRRTGIGVRLALAMLGVAAVVVAIIGVGVMRIGADTFAALMVAAGDSAAEAQAMFDHSVALVLLAAGAIASVAAAVLAWLLARRIARPIERLAAAADAVAQGDLRKRVPEEGPPELRSLAASYNTMADRLAEQEEMRREFVVNASHELRTPLTNLQGYLEALRDGVMVPEPALFDSLREEVDRLGRLAGSLDVLAGAEGERSTPTAVDLGAVVRSSVDLSAAAFARRSIAVEMQIGRVPAIRAQVDDIAQVMANLLQNAARYTPEGGRVRVEVAAEAPEGVLVRVSNSGSPIPADDLPRVWERFYRVEKSRDRALGGAGIGLAIVRRLVEDAGGSVGASSDAAWTTFWFSLPGGAPG